MYGLVHKGLFHFQEVFAQDMVFIQMSSYEIIRLTVSCESCTNTKRYNEETNSAFEKETLPSTEIDPGL